jgi:hypothetical protein
MLASALGCQTVFRVSKFQGVNDEAKTIQLRTLIHEHVRFLRAMTGQLAEQKITRFSNKLRT